MADDLTPEARELIRAWSRGDSGLEFDLRIVLAAERRRAFAKAAMAAEAAAAAFAYGTPGNREQAISRSLSHLAQAFRERADLEGSEDG